MTFELLRHDWTTFDVLPTAAVDRALLRVAHERWGPATDETRGPGYGGQSLAVVLDGTGEIRSSDRRWQLARGSVFAMGPGIPHAFRCGPAGMEHIIVDLAGRRRTEAVVAALGLATGAVEPGRSDLLEAAARQLHAVACSGLPLAHQCCLHQLDALLLLVRSGLSPTQHPDQAEGSWLACKAALDRGYLELASVADAAAAVGVSHEHMCRLFRRHAGTSPGAYLARLKANHAAQLLGATDLDMGVIAERLGYADRYAFAKAFKRTVGVAPGRYRSGAAG